MRYIAGGLSATMNDSDWVITSYLAANATILPITGWLSARLGRRNYFLLSIAVFTVASVLCGMATSLEQLILFRVIQGLAGGGLQPASQGDPARRLPAREAGHGHDAVRRRGPDSRRSSARRWAASITVNYNWRWIFFINLPIGVLGFLMCHFAVEDPDYLKQERAELQSPAAQLRLHRPGAARPGHVLLGDPAQQGAGVGLVRRPVLAGADAGSSCSSSGLGGLIFRELRIANPVVNFRPLGERNLAASCVIIFCAYGVLYGASTSPAGPAPVPVRLRRLRLGPGDVALGRLLDPDDARRRRPPRPGHRRPLADRRGPARHGGRVLLDGADEPGHQPGAGDLAAGGADRAACR